MLPHLSNRHRFTQYDITRKCNLRCAHCRSTSFYEGSNEHEAIRDLTTKEVFKALDSLAEAGIERIHYLGGEPFFRPDMMDIVDYGAKLGIVSSINTNGTLITDEVMERIFNSNLYLLTFSLDGGSPETNDPIRGEGVFKKVTETMKKLDQERKRRKRYIRQIICSVVTKSNAHEMVKLMDVAHEIGCDSVIFTPLRQKGRAAGNLDKLYFNDRETFDLAENLAQIISKGHPQHVQMGLGSPLAAEYFNRKYGTQFPITPGGCNALTTKTFMQPDGSLFPCQELTEFFRSKNGRKIDVPRRSVIDKGGAKAILDSPLYNGLLSAFFKPDALKNYVPCNQCKFLGSICWPCPIPSLRGDKLVMNNCLMMMKKMKEEGIDIGDTVPINYQEVINRSAGDPIFRSNVFANPENTLDRYHYNMEEKDKENLTHLVSRMQDVARGQLKNMLESITKEGVQ
ncbi:MAG TPA: radical SAM protein [Caldisericia bacterium]|nr:radical SAM protein [Caldisericia bacterium]HPF49795.1 radical SAM protein [Caldisericia bacterium]HPI84652.1 radical SAM protein [Caldisericia bacterium]HPQ93894.1 radical SAM protein [Caldisericia bacterium]HRV75683.1 radical SAM protein [Caldisericia bacterium]